MVKSEQVWSGLIVVQGTPSIGPAGTLYVDGTVNGAGVTISGSNPYKWTVTLPTLTAGQTVSMYITATIDGAAKAAVVAEAVADTVRLSDVPAVNVTMQAGVSVVAEGARVVEGTHTVDDILRIIAAALAGETSGSGTATVEILGLDGATTRITATLDGNGNRTSMTLDGT